MKFRVRNSTGSSMLEMPMMLFVLFLGLAFPMLGFATFAYRTMLVYSATRDSCSAAARSSTFTNASAAATTTWNRNMSAWNFISGTETIYIVTKPLSVAPPTVSSTALAAVDTTSNMYLIREISNATIAPLIDTGHGMGLVIPGLTTPFNMQFKVDVYVENPSGLTS